MAFLSIGAAFSERYLGLPAKEEHAYAVRLPNKLNGFYIEDCKSHLQSAVAEGVFSLKSIFW